MDKEQPIVGYQQFFRRSIKERIRIFNDISAENRALLVRTQAERWLAANRSRLDDGQISLAEELIGLITPEMYRGLPKQIEPEIEALLKRIEAVFPRQDLRQLATLRAEYIPE
ncbi:MAG: hypothetical protein R2747_09270 [Pyrinomonadaceae bacterium]